MAIIEITEYAGLGISYGNAIPAVGAELKTQQLTIGAVSVASNVFQAATQMISVWAEADCRIAIGAAPAANNVGPNWTRRLLAGGEYVFAVPPGAKIAVIAVA